MTVLEMVPKLTAKVVTYGVIGTMIRCSFATRCTSPVLSVRIGVGGAAVDDVALEEEAIAGLERGEVEAHVFNISKLG